MKRRDLLKCIGALGAVAALPALSYGSTGRLLVVPNLTFSARTFLTNYPQGWTSIWMFESPLWESPMQIMCRVGRTGPNHVLSRTAVFAGSEYVTLLYFTHKQSPKDYSALCDFTAYGLTMLLTVHPEYMHCEAIMGVYPEFKCEYGRCPTQTAVAETPQFQETYYNVLAHLPHYQLIMAGK